jgi:class 3 adenylate cyclase
VLFADVSGFTAISERLDPEQVHELMNQAFDRMLAEIHRYEGTVNQFLGDGLMALFGAPVAHEDHARRAALAALGLQRTLAAYRETLQRTRGIDFRVRIGLNTGLVVVGAIGDNLRMDYTAVGDTTNVAARMQQVAEPGQIVLAEPTRRLIPDLLAIEDLHWVDGASEACLKALIDGIAGARVLLVLTYRPTYTAPFGVRTYVSRLVILRRRQGRRVLRAGLGGARPLTSDAGHRAPRHRPPAGAAGPSLAGREARAPHRGLPGRRRARQAVR